MQTLRQVGSWVSPIKESLFGTRPSTSYPTVSGNTIHDLVWGVATKSSDDRFEYLHVLKPPSHTTLSLPVPEDGTVFGRATLLKDGTPVALSQDTKGVRLTIPGSWDANDTVIKLTVAAQHQPAEKSTYIDDVSKAIGYSGAWQYSGVGKACSGGVLCYSLGDWSLSDWRQEGDIEDDVHTASRVGNSFTFAFNGTGIDYIAPKTPSAGTATVYLDGVKQGTVDAHSVGGYQRQQVLFRMKGLHNGRHTLKVVLTDGSEMNLDALRVYYAGSYTSPPSAPAPTTRTVTSTDRTITYNGAWATTADQNAGSHWDVVTSSVNPGDSFEYTFNGTGIHYNAPTQPSGGTFDIYIDGILRGQAPTHSTTRTPTHTIFAITDLPMGQHTLKAVAASGSSFPLQSLTIDNPAAGPSSYAWCAPENGGCSFTGSATVAYGADGQYAIKTTANGTDCNNAIFGDPLPGVAKACYVKYQDMKLNDSHNSILYQGSWQVSTGRGAGDYNDDVHFTRTVGNSFTAKFTGTGVEYIAPKAPVYGDIDITVTDTNGNIVRQQRVSAVAPNYQAQQTLFRETGLTYGNYAIRAVMRSGTYFQLDALRIHR
ncbi:hypothetical protein [Streptomyces sp. L2]|uniref:hypothetical protein n=1 Tax=Streptomyces sp. L2 TaxID=2162665 RepID=UPI001011D91F|nr:hypothetical protein [Streptomyces sp. L2]